MAQMQVERVNVKPARTSSPIELYARTPADKVGYFMAQYAEAMKALDCLDKSDIGAYLTASMPRENAAPDLNAPDDVLSKKRAMLVGQRKSHRNKSEAMVSDSKRLHEDKAALIHQLADVFDKLAKAHEKESGRASKYVKAIDEEFSRRQADRELAANPQAQINELRRELQEIKAAL